MLILHYIVLYLVAQGNMVLQKGFTSIDLPEEAAQQTPQVYNSLMQALPPVLRRAEPALESRFTFDL